MAAESFQNEIPPSRVDIRIPKDTGDAKESVEIPHRVMVLGDFTQQEDETLLEDLEKIPINKDNFNSVMESMNIKLDLDVSDKLNDEEDSEMHVSLSIKSINDFRPENIVNQVPELNKLIKIRGLLNDLKARVITNKQFRKELERIATNTDLTSSALTELDQIISKE